MSTRTPPASAAPSSTRWCSTASVEILLTQCRSRCPNAPIVSDRARYKPEELAAAGRTSEPVFSGGQILQSAVWVMRAPVEHNIARRATAAIILAVAAVEALVNDLFVEFHNEHPRRSPAGRALGLCAQLSGFIRGRPREGVIWKIETIAKAFGVTPYTGCAPLQDMVLLIEARNHLVHQLPEYLVRGPSGEVVETDEDFTARLAGHLFPHGDDAAQIRVLSDLLEKADRRWPIETAGATLQLVNSWIPDAEHAQAINCVVEMIWERYASLGGDGNDGLPLQKSAVSDLIARAKAILNASPNVTDVPDYTPWFRDSTAPRSIEKARSGHVSECCAGC